MSSWLMKRNDRDQRPEGRSRSPFVLEDRDVGEGYRELQDEKDLHDSVGEVGEILVTLGGQLGQVAVSDARCLCCFVQGCLEGFQIVAGRLVATHG